MKYILIFFLFVLLLAGCHPSNITPIETVKPAVIATSSPFPTSLTPEIRALEKNSIEFYRNGRTYEVVIGYNTGDALWNVTPQPVLPNKYEEVGWGSAKLISYGDFDQDGEVEFYVSVFYCGANCAEELRLYKYDAEQDQYSIADQVSSEEFRVERYEDLDQDGNPELTVGGLGYCLYGNAGDRLFSAKTVLRYEQGKLTDVTTEFPDVIANDAARRLSFSRTDGDNQGVGRLTLAVYLYNMRRLGKLEEGRVNFDQVCNEVINLRKQTQGYLFDCQAFRDEVEADIETYEQSKSPQP